MNKLKAFALGVGGGLFGYAMVSVGGAVEDRLSPNVVVGQGNAVSESITFDTGHGGSNAAINADSSGNLSSANNWSFTGNIAGDPAFTGGLTVNGGNLTTLNSVESIFAGSGGVNITSGGLTVSGGGTASSQTFKTAIFTGTLTTGTGATITAPSGNIIALLGWNSSNFIPFSDSEVTSSNLHWLAGSSNTNAEVFNPNSITQSYVVIMFYL